MEENENQEPISNSDEFNFSENGKKKKKGMGPVKGLLLALLIVFLICVIGLLIRMVIAGDGDYFKPIKDIFGIEGEEEQKAAPNKSQLDIPSPKNTLSGERYTLLSDDVNDENVKHYRMTLNASDIIEYMMENEEFAGDEDDSYYDDSDNYDSDFSSDDYTYDENYDNDEYSDDEYASDEYANDESSLQSSMENAMFMISQVADMIDGEIYLDVYFEENDLVQVVAGFDYGELVQNLYDYLEENADLDEMKEDGVESAEDLADYILNTINENVSEDDLVDMLMDNEETQVAFDKLGIKEKDIEDAMDIVFDRGLVEFYFNGTTKMKGIISMALDSADFQATLDDVAEENDYEFDEDNLIESLMLFANESDEYKDIGVEFIEVQ